MIYSVERNEVTITPAARQIDYFRASLNVGLLTGALHFAWAMVVAAGYGKAVIDYIYKLHFIEAGMTVLTFNWPTALMLTAISAVSGFVITYLLLWVIGKSSSRR